MPSRQEVECLQGPKNSWGPGLLVLKRNRTPRPASRRMASVPVVRSIFHLIFHNSFVARLWPICGASSQKIENGSVTVLLLIWFIDTIAGNTSSDNQEQLPVSYLGDNEGLNLFKRDTIRNLSWMLSMLLVFSVYVEDEKEMAVRSTKEFGGDRG